MELFVINRHEGDDTTEHTRSDEKSKLDAILKKIKRNKKIRNKQKERESKRKEIIQRTLAGRQYKREKKAKFIPVPDNASDEFIDRNIIENEEKNVAIDLKSKERHTKKKAKLSNNVEIEGFTVLGSDNFDKKTAVKRVLPQWLSNPTVISVNLQNLNTKVSELKSLDKSLRKLLKANGVKHLFPVQAAVIPWLLEANKHADVIFPRDICVSAPTGSGKTLAFVLPIIQALKCHTVKRIRALVILPTQDLAIQVFKAFKSYAQNTNLDVSLITGKNPFIIEQKQLVYENEAFGYISKTDILVCTAGRLVDHLKQTKGFNLEYLEFLVIDEADRVLESVQNDWLYHLEKHIEKHDPNFQTGRILNQLTLQNHRPPQKLLFSATLSQDPEKLQKLSLFQPKLFTSVVENGELNTAEINTDTFIGKFTTPKELTEKYVVTSLELKPLVLYKFVKSEKLTKTIVFTHSADSVHRLRLLLKSLFKDELQVEEISSNLQPKRRKELINNFANDKVDLLICTDALARGIDLPGVQCVISYSAPKYLKTYIHRVGRTARAGEEGLAVTLLHKSQLGKFKEMLNQAAKSVEEVEITEEDLESLGDKYKESLESMKVEILKEEKAYLRKDKSAKRTKNLKRKRKNSIESTK